MRCSCATAAAAAAAALAASSDAEGWREGSENGATKKWLFDDEAAAAAVV
jgi:hypothetical protein